MVVNTEGQRSVIGALALLSTVGYGALYYAQPLLAAAFERTYGWTRVQTSLAFTLALLTTAGLAPAIGRHLDLHQGPRWLSGGAWLGSVAFVVLAYSTNSFLFVLGWLLVGVAMSLTFYEAVFTVLGQQVAASFRRRATLTVTLIAGLASTIFVPLTTALLTAGLRRTLLSLAVLLWMSGLWVWWRIPRAKLVSVPVVPQPFMPDVLFARLIWVFTLARIVTVGVGLQLAPLLLAMGLSPAVAAGLTGLMGLAALPGRVLFTPLLKRLGARPLTVWLLACLGVGTLLLHVTGVLPLTVTGILLFGMTNGALTLARSELLVAAYQPEHYGTANGRLARPVNLAQALTPFGMGLLFTLTGGYGWSLTLLVSLAGVAAWGLAAAVPERRWMSET